MRLRRADLDKHYRYIYISQHPGLFRRLRRVQRSYRSLVFRLSTSTYAIIMAAFYYLVYAAAYKISLSTRFVSLFLDIGGLARLPRITIWQHIGAAYSAPTIHTPGTTLKYPDLLQK